MEYLVITTINPTTKAIKEFAEMGGLRVVVVADRKTPEYADHHATLDFFSVDDQIASGFELVGHTPFNHYCRKNLGYLFAMKEGADTIGETDDDNIPYCDWNKSHHVGVIEDAEVIVAPRMLNVYKLFSDVRVWPRGYPLHSLGEDGELQTMRGAVSVLIWQGLADRDPDVDAIFRLVFDTPEIVFKRRESPAILGSGVYCPFNSQNTVWSREAFMYLYLPMFVRFRFTDILRGYVAQRGIWALNGHLAFGNASVYQERNEHNLLEDFKDEIDCYTRIGDVIDILNACSLTGNPAVDLETMYLGLVEGQIVEEKELQAVRAWIADVTALSQG